MFKRLTLFSFGKGNENLSSLTFTADHKSMLRKRGTLGFSVLRFWLFFRSVFRFLCQKTSVFRFWCSLRFAGFSFFSIWFSVFVKNTSGFSVLLSDALFGFFYFVLFGFRFFFVDWSGLGLGGVNFRFWSHLGCFGQNAIICSRENLL